jgi:hypothetical protein
MLCQELKELKGFEHSELRQKSFLSGHDREKFVFSLAGAGIKLHIF